MLGTVLIYKSQMEYTYKEASQIDGQLRRSMTLMSIKSANSSGGIYCIGKKSLNLLRDDPSFDLETDFYCKNNYILNVPTPQLQHTLSSSSIIRELTMETSSSDDYSMNLEFSFSGDGNMVDSSPPRGGSNENVQEQNIDISLGDPLDEELPLEPPTVRNETAEKGNDVRSSEIHVIHESFLTIHEPKKGKKRLIKMNYDEKTVIGTGELHDYRKQYLSSSSQDYLKRRRISVDAFPSTFGTFTTRFMALKESRNANGLRRSSGVSLIEQARKRRSSSVSSIENVRRFRLEGRSDPVGDEFALEMPAVNDEENSLQLDFEGDNAFIDIDFDDKASKEDILADKMQLLNVIENKMQEEDDNENSLGFNEVLPTDSTDKSKAAICFHQMLQLAQDGSLSFGFNGVSALASKWKPLEPEGISIIMS